MVCSLTASPRTGTHGVGKLTAYCNRQPPQNSEVPATPGQDNIGRTGWGIFQVLYTVWTLWAGVIREVVIISVEIIEVDVVWYGSLA
jgi:hypothetical protein